jgi:hypothetical protein
MLQFIFRDHQDGKMNFELGPLREFCIEIIAKETLIDEYSKKLKSKLLIDSIIEDCTTLTALCESLHSVDAKRKGLISIARLSYLG